MIYFFDTEMRADSRLLFHQAAHLYSSNVGLGNMLRIRKKLHHSQGHVPGTWKTGILSAGGTVLGKAACQRCWEDYLGLATSCRMEDHIMWSRRVTPQSSRWKSQISVGLLWPVSLNIGDKHWGWELLCSKATRPLCLHTSCPGIVLHGFLFKEREVLESLMS